MSKAKRAKIRFDAGRFFRFLFSNTSTKILALGFTGAVILVAVLLFVFPDFDQVFNKFLGPLTTLGTALTALIVWLLALQEKWKRQLEKRLTVHFVFQDKIVMSCFEACLSHESDIRNWAQQLGAQWTGGQRLHFEPYLAHKTPELAYDGKVDYELFTVTLFLTQLPEPDTARGEAMELLRQNIDGKQYLAWSRMEDPAKKEIHIAPKYPKYDPELNINSLIKLQQRLPELHAKNS